MLNIYPFLIRNVYTNCYLLEDSESGKLLVIDPGGKNTDLLKKIDELCGSLEYILLTHGHYDHIMYVSELEKRYHPLICVGKYEKYGIESGSLNNFGHIADIESFEIGRTLDDGDMIELGETKITFMHTPGHTPGSGIFISENIIFSGDTVFRFSIGRTDLPGGSVSQMQRSLRKIAALEGDYIIYPGHDTSTTLGNERRFNPYFR